MCDLEKSVSSKIYTFRDYVNMIPKLWLKTASTGLICIEIPALVRIRSGIMRIYGFILKQKQSFITHQIQ